VLLIATGIIGFHDAVDGQLLSRSVLDTGDGLAEEQVIT
jgi:hypothetical protein